LKDNFLIAGPYFVRLGDLAAGEEKQVSLNLGDISATRFGPPVSYRLYQDENRNGTGDSRLLNLKMSILSSSMNGKGMQFVSLRSSPVINQTAPLSQSLSDLAVTFLGWTEQAPPDVTLGGYPVQKQVIGLVTQTLAYHFGESDELAIPIGMIPGTMTKNPVNGGACGNGEAIGVYMQQGSAEFTFQVPDLGEYTPQELRLNLSVDTPLQNSTNVAKVELYQWVDEAWSAITDQVVGMNAIAQPQKYINAAGEVRVRLTMNENTGGFCSYLDLGLKARKTAAKGGQDASH
jgi:hypothetical protein